MNQHPLSSYEFRTGEELLALCKKYRKPISEIAILRECEFTAKSRKEVIRKMKKIKETMQEAIEHGSHSREKAFMNLAGGDAPKILFALKHRRKSMLMNRLALRAMAYATATGETNACMGRIAAFPTAGGSGVVPGVVFSFAEEYRITEKKHLAGLFTASAIGLLIAENATLSAAAAGCQAEVGAAMAMAAAAVTEMRGGSPMECLNASALALKSYIGVACDPLGGLVAVPCVKRNALGSSVALSASDLTIAGVKSYIPFDEVVEAMWRVGQLMSPKIKETALGGLATTKTGLKIRRELGLPPIPEHLLEKLPKKRPGGLKQKDLKQNLKQNEQLIEWIDTPGSRPISY